MSFADSPHDHIFQAPVLIAGARHAVILDTQGTLSDVSLEEARAEAVRTTHLVCHRAQTAKRLGLGPQVKFYDGLELYAFVRPAQFVVPTADGIAHALGLSCEPDLEAQAAGLFDAAEFMLKDLQNLSGEALEEAARIAKTLNDAGWSWGPVLTGILGLPKRRGGLAQGFDVWNRLPEWEDRAPPPPPGDSAVDTDDALFRLHQLLGPTAEDRAEQRDFTRAAATAFRPRSEKASPNLVIAEAGTGTGKTLGYVAPASLWAEQNGAPVWLSTYTKNLQRQLDQEIARLYPDPNLRADRAVIRKGRENYLCLLNFQEAIGQAQGGAGGRDGLIAIGLIARWAGASRDGAMIGGDFPSYLSHLVSPALKSAVSDRRGECVHSACPHFRRCFIEIAARKSAHANLVIANHALVMIQAALGRFDIDAGNDGPAGNAPTHFVLDEGHHLFEAADSAFSAHLTGLEMAELRRWIRGREAGSKRRGRGLAERVNDLLIPFALPPDADEAAQKAHEDLSRALGAAREGLMAGVQAADDLPGEGWHARLRDGDPVGPAERFLGALHAHIEARNEDARSTYALEASLVEPHPALVERADQLAASLLGLEKSLTRLAHGLELRLTAEASELDTGTRNGIEAAVRGIRRRALLVLPEWRNMLKAMHEDAPEEMVDWASIERDRNRMIDVGLHRHAVDPTKPFAETVLKPAHGVVVTSATLRDQTIEDETGDWESAEMRIGARHLIHPAHRVSHPSPFDFPRNAKVFIVTDVRRDKADDVAAAYRELIKAAGGGTLGLFTAIERLKRVQERIAGPLEQAGLDLYAQHVDPLENSVLVDIFRARHNASLLGTDAMRDGVDVPGRSLRLIVFDRVPWPRPSLLHKRRREAFGRRGYDDMLVRLKLKQAFGRLVRRADDRGCFVMLDAMTPSRLLSAFPDDVVVERTGIADTVSGVRRFLEGG